MKYLAKIRRGYDLDDDNYYYYNRGGKVNLPPGNYKFKYKKYQRQTLRAVPGLTHKIRIGKMHGI